MGQLCIFSAQHGFYGLTSLPAGHCKKCMLMRAWSLRQCLRSLGSRGFSAEGRSSKKPSRDAMKTSHLRRIVQKPGIHFVNPIAFPKQISNDKPIYTSCRAHHLLKMNEPDVKSHVELPNYQIRDYHILHTITQDLCCQPVNIPTDSVSLNALER